MVEKIRTAVAPEEKGQRLSGMENERPFWSDGNILYLEKSLGCTGECIC